MKKWFPYILLLAFVLVISPRNILHAHDHSDQKEEHSKKRGETSVENTCYACDIDLSHFTAVHSFDFHFTKLVHYTSQAIATLPTQGSCISILFSRGPPATI